VKWQQVGKKPEVTQLGYKNENGTSHFGTSVFTRDAGLKFVVVDCQRGRRGPEKELK